MKKTNVIIATLFLVITAFTFFGCGKNVDVSEYFDGNDKFSYATTFSKLNETFKNNKKTWRQGMVGGNGLQGFVTSGAPYNDTLIYQNIHFIMPNNNVRYCPDTSDQLEAVKQAIVSGQDITDNASYDDVYSYHPAATLRIKQKTRLNSYYIRYTDYETAEVGVKYTNKNGDWARSTFSSFADMATITKLDSSSTGAKLSLSLSIDAIDTMANYGKSNEVDIKYKVSVADDCSYISYVAHYPNYENSELKLGGYATVVYVVCEDGSKEKVVQKAHGNKQYAGEDASAIKITDADSVYLIAISDRDDNIGEMSDFFKTNQFDLVDSLAKRAGTIAEKYKKDDGFDYQKALENHLEIYQPQFNAVSLKLEGGDSSLSNEQLIKQAKGGKTVSATLAQRAYYSGRFAYLCSSGYSTSRLYGMWSGEWSPKWGSKYTMDANVNLQTSSLNTSNLSKAPIGYANFILRQVADWEENALATHGYVDALQAPVNTDGDCAVITETCYPYPFRYWNAGASWMLQPLYESLLCYGDLQIPLSGEFDLDALRSVLSNSANDLTDAEVDAIKSKGYLSLKEDVLLPLLTKSANYWAQLLSAEYYTDANGYIHYQQGKTTLLDGETYCILPSYSPENNPSNYPSPSTANCAIDISACRSNLEMLIAVATDIDKDSDVSKWQNIADKLPTYLYDQTGALKEWACNNFEENNEHRHISHLYGVWPLYETQGNSALTEASKQAIANRNSENEASHAYVHRALIAARLKDGETVAQSLITLMNKKIYYNSLMTNHDYDQNSCYCTDFAIGYLGIINECLLYSYNGKIEALLALPTSGFEAGEITGLKTRCQATVNSLKWNLATKEVTLTITSDINQTLTLSSGLGGDAQSVSFAAGETKTIKL